MEHNEHVTGVSGPYTEIKHLGSGAGGAAYLARSSEGREVVIKKVPLGSGGTRHNAHAELQIMRSLEPHPHVVQFFEAFQVPSYKSGVPDEMHIVMQYCAVRATASAAAVTRPLTPTCGHLPAATT